MKQSAHPAILRYARGEISAGQAAGMLSDTATVADVFAMLRRAGLEPPRPPRDVEHAELRRARKILGLAQRTQQA